MKGLRQIDLQKRQEIARMRTGACPTQDCETVPMAVRPVNPNFVPQSQTPRNWWVVSSKNPDGTNRAVITGLAIVPGLQFFMFEVPVGYCLWSLGVDYPTVDGLVIVGDNNPPIPVRAGVMFNLSTDEFPCQLCGPLKVYVQGGVTGGDPPVVVPVNFYAIIAEV